MAEKMPGKRADMLREASGQISVKLYEPLWRKCPYTEIVPKFLAGTPKSAGKNMKNSAIASLVVFALLSQIYRTELAR
jgi:hypothetical protein